MIAFYALTRHGEACKATVVDKAAHIATHPSIAYDMCQFQSFFWENLWTFLFQPQLIILGCRYQYQLHFKVVPLFQAYRSICNSCYLQSRWQFLLRYWASFGKLTNTFWTRLRELWLWWNMPCCHYSMVGRHHRPDRYICLRILTCRSCMRKSWFMSWIAATLWRGGSGGFFLRSSMTAGSKSYPPAIRTEMFTSNRTRDASYLIETVGGAYTIYFHR